MRRRLRWAVGLMVLAVVALLATGCPWDDTTPTAFRIAYQIGGGEFDAKQVKEVVMPGHRVSAEGDDENEYVYGNARNFRISPAVDGAAPDENRELTGRSKPDENGSTYQMLGGVLIRMALNRPDQESCTEDDGAAPCKALFAFYPFCEKYDCTIDDENEDNQNQTLSSDEGWMNMLHESFGNGMTAVFARVIAEYGPDVVNHPEEWPDIGKEIGKQLEQSTRDDIGLDGDLRVWCSTTVVNGGDCKDMDVEILYLRSPDYDAVITTQREAAQAKKQAIDKNANDAAVRAAKEASDNAEAAHLRELYATPGYAQERAYEELLKQINACQGKCIINLGGGATTTQIQVPAG